MPLFVHKVIRSLNWKKHLSINISTRITLFDRIIWVNFLNEISKVRFLHSFFFFCKKNLSKLYKHFTLNISRVSQVLSEEESPRINGIHTIWPPCFCISSKLHLNFHQNTRPWWRIACWEHSKVWVPGTDPSDASTSERLRGWLRSWNFLVETNIRRGNSRQSIHPGQWSNPKKWVWILSTHYKNNFRKKYLTFWFDNFLDSPASLNLWSWHKAYSVDIGALECIDRGGLCSHGVQFNLIR